MKRSDAKGLVLCDHHADMFHMRDPDYLSPPEADDPGTFIYVAFAPSTDPVPTGASCNATLGDSAREHDGALRMYTIQRVDKPS